MARTTAIALLLLITLSLATTTASRTHEIPHASWIKFSIPTTWAQEALESVTEGLQSVLQWYNGWVDCVSNNRQKGLPLLESMVDFTKVLVRCVGTVQDTEKRCSSLVPHQSFPLAVMEVVPPKPKRVKPLRKSKKPVLAKQTELPIILPPPPPRTVIFDIPRVPESESSALRGCTRTVEEHLAFENPSRVPPVLTYIALWLSFIYVVALITDAVSLVRKIVLRSEWLKNGKEDRKEPRETTSEDKKEKEECKDNYGDTLRFELLNRAASRIQAAWRAYHATAKRKARLLQQQGQFQNIILLQRLYHVEEDAARIELQAMTKERRRIATKIQEYEQMSACKLREIVVPDDGNCMFYALSICKFGTPEHHNDLRQEIATWLENNSEFQIEEGLALCLLEGSWVDFVKSMRNDREYGTVSCLYAAAEIFGTTIRVLDSTSDDMTIVPRSRKTDDTFWLTFAQKHYNSLVVDPTKVSVVVPESVPSDMKECTFCTRWFDSPLTTCPRCDTPASS